MNKFRPNIFILRKMLSDFWFVPNDVIFRATEASIFENINFASPVLDIGCGDGRVNKFVFAGKKIDVGIDIQNKVLEQARKSGLYKKVVFADARRLPFEDGSFETVVANSTFEHIEENDLEAVNEVSRVLKTDGIFYLTIPLPAFAGFIRNWGGDIRFLNKRLVHFRYRSLKEWSKILIRSGFRVSDSFLYIPPSLYKIWYFYFRIITFRPYRRELWSYLKDSPYGRLFPRKILSYLSYLHIRGEFAKQDGNEGVLAFIKAQKTK